MYCVLRTRESGCNRNQIFANASRTRYSKSFRLDKIHFGQIGPRIVWQTNIINCVGLRGPSRGAIPSDSTMKMFYAKSRCRYPKGNKYSGPDSNDSAWNSIFVWSPAANAPKQWPANERSMRNLLSSLCGNVSRISILFDARSFSAKHLFRINNDATFIFNHPNA